MTTIDKVTARTPKRSSLARLLPILKKAGRGLRKRDIEREIRAVRDQKIAQNAR